MLTRHVPAVDDATWPWIFTMEAGLGSFEMAVIAVELPVAWTYSIETPSCSYEARACLSRCRLPSNQLLTLPCDPPSCP